MSNHINGDDRFVLSSASQPKTDRLLLNKGLLFPQAYRHIKSMVAKTTRRSGQAEMEIGFEADSDPQWKRALMAAITKTSEEHWLRINSVSITHNPMTLTERLAHPDWRLFANACFDRDNYQCVVCGRTQENTILHCHHRTYERLGFEDFEDLVTLCEECHARYHGKPFREKHPPRPAD
jgi:hypothetical protein